MPGHSTKSESKTADCQGSQLHDIQKANVIVFNPRAIAMQLRNFVRRHKWRLRPLKKLVLPLRSLKRATLQHAGRFFGRVPPRIEPSTLEYASAHTEISVREIYSAELVRLPAHPIRQDAPAVEQKSAAALVFEIPNVNFWAHYGGTVVTADNALLADLSPEVWGAANHSIFSRWHLPESQPLNGRIAIAVTPEAAGNYYHWLIDLLPRILLLKHATQNFSNYDAVLLNGSRADYEGEALTALEVPPEKIRYVDSRDRFQIASAVISSMDHSLTTVASWKIRSLRQFASLNESGQRRRLYLSRRRAAVRRIVNEEEILDLLRQHDFEILELENFHWREQIQTFGKASMIVAPHGAALANIAFCRPGTHVAEISIRTGYRDWYWQLAAVADLRHHFIEAQPRRSARASSFRAMENEDMLVDLTSVKNWLSRFAARPR